jgi:hypothetical protein
MESTGGLEMDRHDVINEKLDLVAQKVVQLQSNYLSACKGRSDFREAYRAERAKNAVLMAALEKIAGGSMSVYATPSHGLKACISSASDALKAVK